jgi:hypothetical protein
MSARVLQRVGRGGDAIEIGPAGGAQAPEVQLRLGSRLAQSQDSLGLLLEQPPDQAIHGERRSFRSLLELATVLSSGETEPVPVTE